MVEIILKSILLGIALAMDACAISMANGLKETNMKYKRVIFIALIFSLFQGIMPLIGYSVGSAILANITHMIPIISLVILSILGVKMIIEGNKFKKEIIHDDIEKLTVGVIFLQAIATSIDALSVGFTISNYTLTQALVCVIIVSIVTFFICLIGVEIGKRCGVELGDKAQIFGGVILLIIGFEIFITSLL